MILESKLSFIGIILVSIVAGLLVFYLVSEREKAEKKQLLNEVTSQLINFIIFIWVGKIIAHFPIFIEDPFAVLAYPSNRVAFYIAVVFEILLISYQMYRKKLELLPFLEAFLSVFLGASFVYEFLQLLLNGQTYNIGYFILIGVLFGGTVFSRGRKSGLFIIFSIWTAGVLLLFFVQPFVTIFGYMIAPLFVVFFYVIVVLLVRFGKNMLR